MSHLRLCIDDEDTSTNFVQFTASGSFSVGDFFKANEAGYMLKDQPVSSAQTSCSARSTHPNPINSLTNNADTNNDSAQSTCEIILCPSISAEPEDSCSTSASATSTPSMQSEFTRQSNNLDIPISQLQRRAVPSPRTLPKLLTSLSQLTITGPLGQGASGLVSKAIHNETGTSLAVKSIPLDLNETKSNRILVELRTLHNSTSPFITSFYGCFFRERALTLCLEYMDGGSLSDFIKKTLHSKPIPENILSVISSQLLRGLDYLHTNRRLIHRDIKPSNILLSKSGVAKLSDFGVSGELGDELNKHSFVGTISYMSPERIQSKPHSFDSDLWSLGLTIAECALGYFPYLPPVKRLEASSTSPQFHPHTGQFAIPPSPSALLYNATQTHLGTPIRNSSSGSPPSPAKLPDSGSNKTLQLPTGLIGASPVRRRSFTGFWDILETIVKSPAPTLSGENYHDINFSADIIDFVSQCCQKEPEKRPTAVQLLQHPFIVKYNPTPASTSSSSSSATFPATTSKTLSAWMRRELAEAKARHEAEQAAILFSQPLYCQTPTSTTSSVLSSSTPHHGESVFHSSQRFTYNVFKQNSLDVQYQSHSPELKPADTNLLLGQKRKITVNTQLESDSENLDSASTSKTVSTE